MLYVSEILKSQIKHPCPNIDEFISVMTGRQRPERIHLAELFADQVIMEWITRHVFEKPWVPPGHDRLQMEAHLRCQIEYWFRMGYDYIRVTGGLDFPNNMLTAENTANLSQGNRGWINSHGGPIQSWADFERYPWPAVREENLWMYDFVSQNLPAGMGMLVCPDCGFLELPSDILVGYEALAMMVYDQPDLVQALFDRVRAILVETYRHLVDLKGVAGFFQGDDMGFRSGTLFSPDFLRNHVLGGHQILADLAHSKGKAYFLHSCGKLDAIMGDLIDMVGIDAKHSYEDVITPVEEFHDRYGDTIGILGGLDVDLLARADEDTVRKRIRKILDHCMPRGRYALGSGNTLTDYCRPENILAMLDEAKQWG